MTKSSASVTDCRAPPRESAITIGSTIPDIDLKLEDGKILNLKDYFSRHSGVLFAVPGAFTPTCSQRHLPGFLEKVNEVKSIFDFVGCSSVNDPFVMKAWEETQQASNKGITFIADPKAELCKSFGLIQDLTEKGLSIRSQRFAVILARGVVQWIGLNDDSFVDNVLKAATNMSFSKFDIEECLKQAKAVCNNSHSPYGTASTCGVAIQTDKGTIRGCTVDNCAFPSSICAIKATFVMALSEGVTRIDGCAVVGSSKTTNPYLCGQCREIMSECGEFPVVIATADITKYKIFNVIELLPGKVFSSEFLSGRKLELAEQQTTGYKPKNNVKASDEFLTLYQKAIGACRTAYIPVSHFPVGAAVLTDKGIFTGSNVENAVIGLGLCAERCSICKAVASGATSIKAIAIVCYKMEAFGSPCGGCRQSLVEFENFAVHLLRMDHKNKEFDVQVTSTFELLPDAFTPAALK